ncbi:MAG: inorganic phosphate transporter [Cellulophaga sp.]|uniref:inorganic phosphate transporter n=1 Tax=unclassified Cellulophaga TaxID=2634405 RepID=UPI000C2C6CB4|nr:MULTISPECIES: inorganic phosphate transporter [unclassified Cellulophaga]MDO6490040.1 inorganic phosphate transporter [Cellulophaga sp. 2_MG-2023]MDO6494766.1 inorganic phosphate transporter [Cellulophaga sp. 3_MG-2023]PKB42328.1 phosphate transporter family protein [Cellulophaga sp. RHA19]
MESNIYLIMIIALAVLAIADLVVGVSNDAVNFLNSAIGSKAISFRSIMIVASVGIACGAIFSSGMMEVARKGIFNPNEFYFNEIMFIFMAVMITDILLLDFFNTLGMPTSTTVSIVFELLGAAVAMALIKILQAGGSASDVVNYINTSKATEIIIGILLSVVIAFSIGAIVQWFSRLLLSYDFERKAKWVGAVFGGVGLSAITYFIFMKGIKGTAFASQSIDIIGDMTIKHFLEVQWFPIVLVNFVIWFVVSYVLTVFAKLNIYKIIIGVGTFALALAFAGNDLVNFIGVPIAAYQSYTEWSASGVDASAFSMAILTEKVPTPTLLLFISGMIMVATLWFSKKARYVAETEINLSREGEGKERFEPNFLSRGIVRIGIAISTYTSSVMPKSITDKVEARFEKPKIALAKDKTYDMPAFDMVRAAVNLVVAGILISVATSFKLPLSTTYVTFMVAMGTSLADRAWGAESAVYRVAGVLNVIGGWFGTAIIAFTAAGIILTLINFGTGAAIAILLFVAILLLARNYISYNKKSKEIKAEDSLRRAESSSIQGVIVESAKNTANVVKRTNKIYTNAIDGLAKQNLDILKKNKKGVVKLGDEVDDLRDHIFYFIKNLDDASVGASNFYINILGSLQDMAQSLEYITKISYKHINNNHKKLKYNQIKELKEIDYKLEHILNETQAVFETRSFDKIAQILEEKEALFELLSQKIQKQVERTRTEESSPKNTTLYFSLLLETKDLMTATINMLELYYNEHDSSVPPATIS